MFVPPGYVPSGTQADPLSSYERSRLGRWRVAKEIEPDDSEFGIELKTPVGPIRIRFETKINEKSFRAPREKTIDELLAIAKGDVDVDAAVVEKPTSKETKPKETTLGKPAAEENDIEEKKVKENPIEADVIEQSQVAADVPQPEAEFGEARTYFTPTAKERMIAYAKSRADRLTRYELRRRVADIAGGPSLLRTSNDFGSQRHETVTLFAFLDTNEDGAISPKERSVAVQVLNDLDVNSDGKTDWNELQRGLRPRTSKRKNGVASVDWQPWDTSQSDSIEDLIVAVSFNDAQDESGLTIDDCELDEQWEVAAAKVRKANAESAHGSVVLASRPKFSLALSAAQSADETDEATEQISIGVTLESNALFRSLDRDGDWSLSTNERDSIDEVITSLDANADGSVVISELPILLRVCVSRGAKAHEALADNVSIVLENDEEEHSHQAAPDWFVSMDQDGSRTLTRKEFLGERTSFDEIDTDRNDLLSVAEVLAAESD